MLQKIPDPSETGSPRRDGESLAAPSRVAAAMGATEVVQRVDESLQALDLLAEAGDEDDQSLQSSIADFMGRLFGESGRAGGLREALPQSETPRAGPATAPPAAKKPQARNPRAPEQPALICNLRDAANEHARDLLVDYSRRQRRQMRQTWLLGLLAVACTMALIGAAQRGATPAWYGAWLAHGAAMICTAQLFRLGKRPARERNRRAPAPASESAPSG
jgi:hypothetical protein